MTVIRKFGPDFGRRKFLTEMLAGVLNVGVLGSSWRASAAAGDSRAAYPDELLHIEALTKGRLQPGDVITRDNVHLVSDLLDPVRMHQIRDLGRRLVLAKTTTELDHLSPAAYLEASLRNAGKARFDAKGNVVTLEGGPWIGGNPFPDPKNATEVFAAHTLSWGRHESCLYAIREYDIDPLGQVQFQYASGWAELSSVERQTNSRTPALTASLKDKLRLQSVFFVSPTDVRGVAYLNIWPYDQTQFPELYGYLPAFKRVRRFPTNQRFEPLIPGSELYLSDAWAAGDPFLTWGDYRIVRRGPIWGLSREAGIPSMPIGSTRPMAARRGTLSGIRRWNWFLKRLLSRRVRLAFHGRRSARSWFGLMRERYCRWRWFRMTVAAKCSAILMVHFHSMKTERPVLPTGSTPIGPGGRFTPLTCKPAG